MPLDKDDEALLKKIVDAGGRRVISGNTDRLHHLVEEGFLTADSVNLSDVLYAVTERGRAVIEKSM
jgi:hypothetical protein